MPDSLPPDDEGPDPYEGQDLDGLLSGENGYVPEELLKVVPALDALRAAPGGTELFGEAAARANFRKIMLSGGSGPAFPGADTDDARTLILPPVTSGGESPTVGESHAVQRRPHSHRRPPQRGRWSARALAGVAAAAVAAVGAVALAATLSTSSGHPAASRLSPGVASETSASTTPGSHAVDGSGTPEPTVKPSPTGSSQSGNSTSPIELCREYFAFLADPRQHGNSVRESDLYQQLSALADGRGGVNYYCMRRFELWEVQQGPENFPGMPGGPGQPGSQGAQLGGGQDDNGQGRNGPGFGGQP